MNLPAPIQAYFTAQSPRDGAALAAAFAPDAIVRDEGRTHSGPEEILHWWEAARARYDHRAEPLDARESGGKTAVHARVSGNFPGSPAVLSFTFGLNGGRITDLEIG